MGDGPVFVVGVEGGAEASAASKRMPTTDSAAWK